MHTALKYLFISFILFCGFRLQAQEVRLQGTVTDTAGTALGFANVIADGQNIRDVRYTISNENGRFRISLQKGKTYRLTFSHLGFRPKIINLTLQRDTTILVKLHEGSEKLDTVVISYKPPIKIKEDTITYLADKFRTGEERKLRQILNQLPGVEVDEEGNVRFNGRRVKKILVENKTFFTGDPKLAVNYIPANAVDAIQMLENYHELSYMKDFERNDDLAMNIKLKKDKKKFYFGDLEAGYGPGKRYHFHPAVFRYSPRRRWQLIGDINNINKRSFGLRDYLRYEGQLKIGYNIRHSGKNIRDPELMRFLQTSDSYEGSVGFGAFHIVESFGEKSDLNAFVIADKSKTFGQQKDIMHYFSSDDSIVRNKKIENRPSFIMGHTQWSWHPGKRNDVFLTTFVKTMQVEKDGVVGHIYAGDRTGMNKNFSLGKNTFKQSVEWYRQINFRDVLNVYALIGHEAPYHERFTWSGDTLLNGWLPGDTTLWNITNYERNYQKDEWELMTKYYWAVTRMFHIYFSAGTEGQFIKESRNVHTASKNNTTYFLPPHSANLLFLDTYTGLEVKTKWKQWIAKPGIFIHQWQNHIESKNTRWNKNEILLLPQLHIDRKFTPEKSLSIRYRMVFEVPNERYLFPGYDLPSLFHTIEGSPRLHPSLYHDFSFFYSLFQYIRKKRLLNFMLNYRHYVRTLQNITYFKNGRVLMRYRNAYMPDKNFIFSLFAMKGIKFFRFSAQFMFTYTDVYSVLNDKQIHSPLTTFQYGGGIKYNPSDYLRLSLDFSSMFTNNELVKNLSVHKLEGKGFYRFHHLNFSLQGSYAYFTNEEGSYHFPLWHSRIWYHHPDSPWTFEWQVYNLFNVKFKLNEQTTSIYFHENYTYVTPRLLQFNVVYNF